MNGRKKKTLTKLNNTQEKIIEQLRKQNTESLAILNDAQTLRRNFPVCHVFLEKPSLANQHQQNLYKHKISHIIILMLFVK